jgi:hypothetical protein
MRMCTGPLFDPSVTMVWPLPLQGLNAVTSFLQSTLEVSTISISFGLRLSESPDSTLTEMFLRHEYALRTIVVNEFFMIISSRGCGNVGENITLKLIGESEPTAKAIKREHFS